MPNVHGVFAQPATARIRRSKFHVPRPSGSPRAMSAMCIRTQSTPAYTTGMHQDFRSNDSMHSVVSASGRMNACNTNLSSCSPADVRARALEAGAFFPLFAANCSRWLPPGVPTSPLSWAACYSLHGFLSQSIFYLTGTRPGDRGCTLTSVVQSDAIGVTFTRPRPIFLLSRSVVAAHCWEQRAQSKDARTHSLGLDLMAHPRIPHPCRGNSRDSVPAQSCSHTFRAGPRIRAAVPKDFPNLALQSCAQRRCPCLVV